MLMVLIVTVGGWVLVLDDLCDDNDKAYGW